MLYFTPGTHRGNGLGVFNAYEKSKSDSEVHSLVKYLINWVAGTKLIFKDSGDDDYWIFLLNSRMKYDLK